MLEVSRLIKWILEKITVIQFTMLALYRKTACRKMAKNYIWKGRDQNIPAPRLPLWHVDYFERKTLEKQQIHKVSDLPLSIQEQGVRFARTGMPSLHQEKEHVLTTGDRSQCPDASVWTKLLGATLLFHWLPPLVPRSLPTSSHHQPHPLSLRLGRAPHFITLC